MPQLQKKQQLKASEKVSNSSNFLHIRLYLFTSNLVCRGRQVPHVNRWGIKWDLSGPHHCSVLSLKFATSCFTAMLLQELAMMHRNIMLVTLK